MDLNLRGRTALVTGGSKGIGLAIAKALAAEGCHLHLVARTASELTKVADDIGARHNVSVTIHPADLTDSSQIKNIAAHCGVVDILVNSAGGIPRGTLTEIDEERWRKSWDLKVFGAINLTRELYGPMCARGKGVIINIVGISGDRPDAYYIAGSAANAALIMFSRSLGGDSIRHGVRVVAVNPGPVETEKHIRDTERLAQERFGDKSRWRDVMAGLPMKRAALPDEVSAMVAQGHRAVMLFLIQIGSARRFALARDIDAGYGAAFDLARAAGVEAIAYRCGISCDGIEVVEPVPVSE